jgi:hypothetical protein
MFKLTLKKKPSPKSVTFDLAFQNKIGRYLRDQVVLEARKQAALDARKRAAKSQSEASQGPLPEGLPQSEKFFGSFHWRVIGAEVQVYSTWPTIEQLVDGRSAYKMTWLTQTRGVKTVPFYNPTGKIIFRTTPKTQNDAWIHPGFAKHDFIQRAFDRALPEVKKMYAQEALRILFQKGI